MVIFVLIYVKIVNKEYFLRGADKYEICPKVVLLMCTALGIGFE